MSIAQHIRDVGSAVDASKASVRHAMSTSKIDEHRAFLLADSYAFTLSVCGHKDLAPDVHMPMSYAATGSAELFAWSITQSGFEGYVIDQFREACAARGIDPKNPADMPKLRKALAWVNFRFPRRSFKSSVVTHGGATFTATNDPNSTAKITTAVDPKAWELCAQIGKTVQSGRYRDIFPDRVPVAKNAVAESAITLAGRTISHPQPTISAFGYKTKDTGGHYDTFWTDDLVVGGKGGNATPAELPGVEGWLTGMSGFFMPTRQVRRIHVGTRWDENDDHAWLTTGRRSIQCFSVLVPIEIHDAEDGEVVNILERGTPTMPSFLSEAKIQELQDATFSDEREVEGARMWRCNDLLNPGIAGGRLFSKALYDDKDRQWMGPHKYPTADKKVAYKDRFLVSRYARDDQGRSVDKNDVPLIETYKDSHDRVRTRLIQGWKLKAKRLTFDPWRDMDMVMTLDPSWKEGGNNWAITAAAIDYQRVKFQLETQDGTTGVEGWIEALAEMHEVYNPRVIGFGAGGFQDPIIQNILRTDPRLRKLRSKMVPIPEVNVSKPARIKNAVAEPLKMYRWLLDPSDWGQPTRNEMKDYKGDANAIDGILDSLAMVDALLRVVKSPDDKLAAKERIAAAQRRYRESIDPTLGVPVAA